jgi:hypothetical protein
MQLLLQHLLNTIHLLISLLLLNLFKQQTHRQMRSQNQISSLTNVISGVTNDLGLRCWHISDGFPIIWVSENDN